MARLSIAVGALMVLVASGGAPAWAAPDSPAGTYSAPPDAGSRPALDRTIPGSQLPRPGNAPITAGSIPSAIPADPVLARISTEQAAVEALSERVNEAQTQLEARLARQALATVNLTNATTALLDAQQDAADWTRDSYIAEAQRPDDFPEDPRNGMLGRSGLPEVDTPLHALAQARSEHAAARTALVTADTAVTTQQGLLRTLRADLTRRGAALQALQASAKGALASAERSREGAESGLAGYVGDAGGYAGKAAITAIQFALAQLGKPYEWGAEGPDRYDCSGLVQAAYAMAGVQLPRTARPQYLVSKQVAVSQLLPGDLLFFATDKTNWDSIHHVAIYLGDNKMLHAPTTGDVVRVAPVWWAEFFAAGRIVPGSNTPRSIPAVPGVTPAQPEQTAPSKPKPAPPKPKPAPAPSPSPSPSRSPSPSGSPSSSPSTSPEPSGSPTPSRSPSPSTSGPPGDRPTPGCPDPSSSPSPSGSPGPSRSAGPSPSRSPGPSASGSPSATPDDDDSASPVVC